MEASRRIKESTGLMIDIVLISGKQGGGKTTTANAVIAEAKRLKYSKAFQLNFAEPLYVLHDFILNKMESAFGVPKTTNKDGVLLQVLGTEWGRKVHGENIWCQIMKNRIDAEVLRHTNDGSRLLFVIADCRFENEFNFFHESLRVRLQCSAEERKVRTNSWRENVTHPSETNLDDYDLLQKFDLYIDTTSKGSSPEHCASLILAQLQKRSWLEKRKVENETPIS
jgi:hypothetical protein